MGEDVDFGRALGERRKREYGIRSGQAAEDDFGLRIGLVHGVGNARENAAVPVGFLDEFLLGASLRTPVGDVGLIPELPMLYRAVVAVHHEARVLEECFDLLVCLGRQKNRIHGLIVLSDAGRRQDHTGRPAAGAP